MASAWERKTRPAQPCVACGEPPDRVMELPELEDVHVAFGSSALCDACAQLALAGDAVRLAQRATTGGRPQDEPEAVPDLVKLLMAWAGHRMPPGPATPEPHRHVELRPLSAEDAAVWRRLDPLMVDGPAHRVSVHGHISHTVDGSVSGQGRLARVGYLLLQQQGANLTSRHPATESHVLRAGQYATWHGVPACYEPVVRKRILLRMTRSFALLARGGRRAPAGGSAKAQRRC